nr:hypothetical protein Iba_chr12aCG2660 [Ipomoea batatas]GMD62622.1 hypothetical protein Iba_chr12bCG7170 [Ipomoea batatas]GMD65320.1 hypothetical protein Iba_chr12cCG4260 [Ipomoea batatas]GMD67522.1 hypothetical protein Iba_chr12dCG0330 [Ipomoea batatas]GMD69865.1 hypothetical protein Iba_chr12eCG0760 [Ipomoea batatas]
MNLWNLLRNRNKRKLHRMGNVKNSVIFWTIMLKSVWAFWSVITFWLCKYVESIRKWKIKGGRKNLVKKSFLKL